MNVKLTARETIEIEQCDDHRKKTGQRKNAAHKNHNSTKMVLTHTHTHIRVTNYKEKQTILFVYLQNISFFFDSSALLTVLSLSSLNVHAFPFC